MDDETREFLETFRKDSGQLTSYVSETLADLLCKSGWVEILGFGTFRVKLYRPFRPARLGDHSFVEAPYVGPVEFSPSALLLRQLHDGEVDASIVARCDELYTRLRDDEQVSRGKIPLVIKSVFHELTASLIERRMAELPSIGCLHVRRRPVSVAYDPASSSVKATNGRPTLILRLSKELIDRIPAYVIPVPPPNTESHGPVLSPDVEDLNAK